MQKTLDAYQLVVRTRLTFKNPSSVGSGLKLRGSKFGHLTLDPLALATGRVRAFSSGRLALEAPADETLYALLTKRLDKAQPYTPRAIETLKKLVELAGLPVHGRQSKKHQLIRGGVIYYNDPNALVERLQLLAASKRAGNTGVDAELACSGAVPKEAALQLNRTLLA